MHVWLLCISVYRMHTQYLWRPEKGIRYPGTRVIDHCELSYRCWESNPGPLKDQPSDLLIAE